jgi:diguanylate cyclase (GGDEF)-like protein/PAS domain S-box-containing protein
MSSDRRPRAEAPPVQPKPSHGVEWLCLICAFCSIAVGSLVLFGWSRDIEILKRLSPGLVAMNPATALCCMLAGLAVAFHHFRMRRTACALGVAVASIGLAKLTGLFLFEVPVDQFLFADRLQAAAASMPNRMAPNTASALFLLGASLVLAASPRRKRRALSEILASFVMLISMFAVVGYVFGIQRLHSVGAFIPMALHTALTLLVVSIGALASRPDSGPMRILRDDGPAGSMARTVLPLAILIPVAVGAMRLWGQHLGFYGTEEGIAVQVVANVAVTSALLIWSIRILYRSDNIRKQREQALQESDRFNRIINEASPDCVSLLDSDGNVLFANDAAVQAYGLRTADELIGRPWGHLLDGSAVTGKDTALAEARDGKVGRVTLCLGSAGHAPRWFESLVSKVSKEEQQPYSFIVMSRDITQQRLVEEQVRWTATHDPLTQLPNRRLFQTQLDDLGRNGRPRDFALLILDVDGFKQINDTLGHDAGDALLMTVGERLRSSIRDEDFVARLGGDEFAIILSGVKSEAGTIAGAEKILAALREPWVYDGRVGDVRVSIGASLACIGNDDSSGLLKDADIALYAAKVSGEGRIALFRPEMRAVMQSRSSKISLARHALKQDLIRPFYQPKVELSTGKLIGFEALLRWNHPTRGVQMPESIDAAFEDLELARALTDRILSHVVGDIRRWIDEGLGFGHVAVNAAAADFKQPDFAERLLARLEASVVPASCLQIEVTETVFLGRGAEYVEQALKALSGAGIRIALDDFGTGYASLSHLKQFPVEIVKIDRSFLRNIRKDAHNDAIVRTVVGLGRSLDLDVVAEGVETLDQEAYLIAQGCRIGQGYLYGKATPASRVSGVIKSWEEKPAACSAA